MGYNTKHNFFWENKWDHVCMEISSFSSLVKNICSDELYIIALQKSCDETLYVLRVYRRRKQWYTSSQTVQIFCLNTIIWLNSSYAGGDLPSLLPLLEIDAFLLQLAYHHQKQGRLLQINLCPSNKPKRTCIRPCDTNNSTQNLKKM